MNVLITGGSSGIGSELVRLFAQEGHTVFSVSRRGEEMERISRSVSDGKIFNIICDLAGPDFSVVTDCLEKAGVFHLDILIHNAGAFIHKPFDQITRQEWEYLYSVNVFGVVSLTQTLIPRLGNSGISHVVMISSIGGITGSLKFGGLSAYSSSKGAGVILCEVLAEEWKGTDIRVNCLAFGSVETPMLKKAFPGLRGNLTAQEAAEYIYRFSTEGGRYFHGKVIPVSTGNP
jgi:3-oxoacyl-[acyl-carrier protein] reductase